MLAAAVALGAIAVVLLVTGGGDSPEKKPPAETGGGTSRSPEPSLSIPSELPSELPSGLPSEVPSELPSRLPSDFPSDLQTLFATPAGKDVPYYMLKAGDCFDADADQPGQAARRSCREPHDAEVVTVEELEGIHETDAALRKAALALCEKPLARAAAEQPGRAVRVTLVQYPDTATYRIGIDSVACSLSAGAGSHGLSRPLK
ncbi:hypothetical protein ACFV6E_01235 [Streptomyces sp. NPDC059785]|uniref:hypothetical protein n=1 Tax=unclassified Streptomyces TaxID=2593676 RepID=UPI00365F324F